MDGAHLGRLGDRRHPFHAGAVVAALLLIGRRTLARGRRARNGSGARHVGAVRHEIESLTEPRAQIDEVRGGEMVECVLHVLVVDLLRHAPVGRMSVQVCGIERMCHAMTNASAGDPWCVRLAHAAGEMGGNYVHCPGANAQ